MNNLILSSTSDFMTKNLWWIIAGGILLVVGVYFIVSAFLPSKKSAPKVATKSEYLDALGGADNILDKELKGSRIVVKLQDYTKVNQDKLKEAGVTGFIEMSDKLTLVIKDNAQEAFEVIFGSND